MKIDPRRTTVYVYQGDNNVYLAPRKQQSKTGLVAGVLTFFVATGAFVAAVSSILLLALELVKA